MTDDLLVELARAEGRKLTAAGAECQACAAVRNETDPERKEALERALGGTIGRDTLIPILQRQGIMVGRRHLVRHRQEGHKP